MTRSQTAAGILIMAFLAIGSVQVYGQAGDSAPQAGQFTVGGRLGGAIGFTESHAGTERILRPLFSNPDARVSVEPELNFNFALYGNYAITNRISIQAELNFMISQGYELTAPRLGRGLYSFDINYSSLDIPLLLRFAFLSSRPVFGIMAGPHISIPLGRLEIYSDHEERYIGKLDIDSNFTLGFTAGLFGGFQAGPGRIVGDLRFIFDFDSLQAEGVEFIRRRAAALSIGYEISF